MNAAERGNGVPGRKIRRALSWGAGLLLLAAVAALYVLYHRRNWCLMGRVADMVRVWWYQLRIAAGL